MAQFHRITFVNFTPFTNQLQLLFEENHDLLADIYELAEANEIGEIAKRSYALLSNAEQVYREQEKLFSSYQLFEGMAKKEDDLLTQLVQGIETMEGDNEQAKAEFLAGLQDSIDENPETFESNAETLYNQIKEGEAKLTEEYFDQAVDQFEEMGFTTYMSSLKFGLNLYVSQAFLEGQHAVKNYPSDALLLGLDSSSMLTMCETLNTTFLDTFHRLNDALENEIDMQDFKNMVLHSSQDLMGLVYIAYSMLGQFNHLAKRNLAMGNNPKEIYHPSLDLAHAASQMQVLILYLNYAKFKLSAKNDGHWYGGEKRRVDTRETEFETPKGDSLSIEDALSVTEPERLVEIEGIVESIVIEDDQFPPKFSTFMVLKDKVSGASIKTRAHMHSLINNGINGGSYCRVNGYIKQEGHWLTEGEAGMDLDRFSLVDLAKESWIADVVHRMKPYHTLYPDEMNMIFTP